MHRPHQGGDIGREAWLIKDTGSTDEWGVTKRINHQKELASRIYEENCDELGRGEGRGKERHPKENELNQPLNL